MAVAHCSSLLFTITLPVAHDICALSHSLIMLETTDSKSHQRLVSYVVSNELVKVNILSPSECHGCLNLQADFIVTSLEQESLLARAFSRQSIWSLESAVKRPTVPSPAAETRSG